MNTRVSVLLNYQKSIEYDLQNFGKGEDLGKIGVIVYLIIIAGLLVLFIHRVVVPVVKHIIKEIRPYLKK
ncbi:MAG: hypothetical protein WC914_02610 [Proteiniphilum sp.]